MRDATAIVGQGRHTFEVHEDWARPPEGMEVLAASVTVDAEDRVYCFNRNKEHPVLVFDCEGNFLSSWGAGLFAFPHTIRMSRDDGNLWLVDRDYAQMMLFDTSGANVHHMVFVCARLPYFTYNTLFVSWTYKER